MATIQFKQGYSWEVVPKVQVSRLVDVEWLRSQLAVMRQEWIETGCDMENVTVNLNLLFSDIEGLVNIDDE